MTSFRKLSLTALLAAAGLASFMAAQSEQPAPPVAASTGCISCHGQTDSASMHPTGTVQLTCTDCHGGHAAIMRPANAKPTDRAYRDALAAAHPKPKLPALWKTSANPVRPAAAWLQEDKDYIRFVNPGDLRVAPETCGSSK